MIEIIIVYSIALLLLLPFIFVKSKRIILSSKFSYAIYFVKNVLGWIIGINGPIRVGKTSSQSGLSSICQIIIIQEINELLDRTMKIFKMIDFNELHNDLIKKFDESEHKPYPEFEVITDEILIKYKLNGEALHFNMIGNIKVRKLILDYIFAYYCLMIRNNFVQSKTSFYSNITHQFSINLNTDWLKIREAYKSKDYAILDWMVILIDELTDEASAMSYLSDIKDEQGGKEYRRKFGQIHQERNRIITTKQDVMDEVKKYRNLTHSNLILEDKVSTTGNHMWIFHIIKFFNQMPERLLKIFIIIPRFLFRKITFRFIPYHQIYKYYHDKVGWIRKQESKLYYYKMFFDSIGYNRYSGYILKQAEDIERSKADRDLFTIYIPTIYCWGTYDTHFYKDMQIQLLKNSNTKPDIENPFVKKTFFEPKESLTNQIKEIGDDNFEF